MTRWVDVIAFDASTSVGNQTVTQNILSTGKAVIFITQGRTIASAASVDYNLSVGFSVGAGPTPVNYQFWQRSEDGLPASNSTRSQRVTSTDADEYCIATGTNLGDGRAKFISFNSGSFTIEWETGENPADTYRIIAIVIGGADVSANIIRFIKKSSTGTQDITGFGFNPANGEAFGLLLGTQLNGSTNTDNHLSPNLGVFTSTTAQGMLTVVSEDNVTTTDTSRACRGADRCYASVDLTTNTHSEAAFNGWITDGFQLNWVKADASDRVIAALVVSGGGAVTVTEETLTSTGTTHSTTGLSFGPGFVFRFGHGTTESSATATDITVQNGNMYIIGASNGTVTASFWGGDQDAVPDTVVDMYQDMTNSYISRLFGGSADGALSAPTFTGDGATYTKTAPAADQFTIALYMVSSPPTTFIPSGRTMRPDPASRTASFYTRVAGSDRGGQRKRLKIFDRNIVR